MNTRKWLISVVTLTLALSIAGVGMAFALAADGGSGDPEDPTATSIDDIDPNLCNAIHNINACTPEELEELGLSPVTGSIAVGEYYPVPNPEANPEPLFPDGEAQYEVQSHEEAVAQDCGLAGGTIYVTADGEVGCNIVHDLQDGGVGETPAQSPAAVPEPEVLPSAG